MIRSTRRTLLGRTAQFAVGAAVLGVGGLAYARAIEPEWIEITRLRLALPGLPGAFRGYRVAHLSDIHMDRWMTGERLAGIVSLVNAQWPDLVALTGDYVTHGHRRDRLYRDLATGLGALRTRDGVVAVLGNHDHWLDAAFARRALRGAGAIELGNRAHVLRRGDAMFYVGGVDDYWTAHARLDDVLDQVPAGSAAILLAHEPDFADLSAPSGRFALQLSGHSHGGQVRLPLLGPPILPPYGRKYPMGLYRVGRMWLYTNRGVGMLSPRVRLNCRPEITVYTLETA
jgi:hypothetical protein